MASLRMPGGIGRRVSSMGSNPLRGIERMSMPRLGVQRRLIPSVKPKRILGGISGAGSKL